MTSPISPQNRDAGTERKKKVACWCTEMLEDVANRQ